MKIKAIYPGTFDPIPAGHEDHLKRASYIFESVIVAVASNTQKNTVNMINMIITFILTRFE